ncbi:MAG: c-type cytochrome [Acidobacteriaceae bacterium]
MRTRFLFLGLLLIFAFSVLSQQSDAPKTKTAVAGNAASDTPKPTPDLLAKAKKLYGYDCAMCHGETGDGKGDLSADYSTKLKDLTDPATLKDYSDEQLLQIIRDGKGDMPPEGKRAKTDELWGLVYYVRSLAKK